MFGIKIKKEFECVCTLNVSESDKQFKRNQVSINKFNQVLCFDDDIHRPFEIINFEWDGANYKIETKFHSVTETKGKTKRSGRLLGAAVGNAVAPGVGALVGALHGTSNSKTNSTSSQKGTTREFEREIPTRAFITIKYTNGNEVERFSCQCLRNTAEILKKLVPVKKNSCSNSTDSLVYLKELKELLDLGAITQEEFDMKKKELLNL